MKKAIFSIVFFVLLFIALPMETNAAAGQSKIILDGQELVLPTDVQVSMVNTSLMIPIRVVAENLKFKVDWDQKTHNVKIQHDSKMISLTVDQKEANVADTAVLLDVAPQVMNSSVVVPIRFVSEQMGLSVNWDNKDKAVYLTSSNKSSSPTQDPSADTNSANKDSLKHVHDIQFMNNQLVISIDGEVKPVIFSLNNPNRVVVDLPNTTFGESQSLDPNLNGKLDVSGSTNVSEVRYSLFQRDPDQVRIVMVLNDANAANFSYEFIENQLIVGTNGTSDIDTSTSIPPVDGSIKKIVVIDPGHGGSDPGTTSISNTLEKDFTLALSLKIQALLLQEPNIQVVMTRESDTYPTRPERVLMANQLNADIFVSIHGNSAPTPQASGTETYFYQRNNSKELANMVHKHLVPAIGLKDRGVRDNSLQVIRETNMAAVLLEIGFLSNSSDEEVILSETVQNQAAQAIVNGIKEYLGVK